MHRFSRTSLKIIGGILLVYGLLVATHRGEFWPFSIFPMFSQAGNPWTRALVQDVTHTPDSLLWQTTDLNHLHGPTVVLKNTGVNQIDFSDFVSKTKVWDTTRRKALLQKLHADNLQHKRWLITKVQGYLTHDDSVIVQAIPFLLVRDDTVLTNPTLPKKLYYPQP